MTHFCRPHDLVALMLNQACMLLYMQQFIMSGLQKAQVNISIVHMIWVLLGDFRRVQFDKQTKGNVISYKSVQGSV